MPATNSEDVSQVAKWFTRARKFPQLVGKTHDGKTIWGGPYTFTQVFAFVGILFLASRTTGLWAQFGLLGNIAVAGGTAYGVTWSLGRLPVGARNPVWIIFGTARSLSSPSSGRLAGQRIRIAKPHRVRSRLSITTTSDVVAPRPPATTTPAPTASTTPPAGDRSVCGAAAPSASVLQRLLATQTTTRGS